MSGHGYLTGTNRLAEDATDAAIGNEREDQWGEMPGRIVSFDAEKQTATIKPLMKKNLAGKATALPELLEVPVRFARAGGGAVTMPVKAGDHVTLRPSMRSTEAYHTGKGADGYEAPEGTSLGLSNMEAFIDGGESLTDPIKNFDAENFHARFDDEGKFGIRGSAAGKIKIEGSGGDIYDLIATVVELLATDTLEIKHGSSTGTGHALQFQEKYAEIAGKLRAMAL
jgi:hypothetical protein